MIGRYKEIFSSLLIGLAMWIADAQMHTMMPVASPEHRPSLAEEVFSPDGPLLFIRLLYVSFALFFGWLLWRSNRGERAVREPEREEELFHCQVVYPAMLISDAANKLLRGGEWKGQNLEAVNRISQHARRIEDFVKHLPRYSDAVAFERPLTAGVELKVASWWERLKAANVAQALASVSLMVAAGFAARFITVLFAYDEQLTSSRGDFEFGWEVGRVARSLASGHGFSSPLWGETGPTAWLPPVYPLLLAGVFKTFGTYTAASAIVILSLNALFSSLTAIPIVLIARRTFGDKIAVWAGWSWAFFPYAIFINAFRVWGEGLDALLVALILLLVIRLAETSRIALWFGCGLLTGVAALTNPNTLAVMPGLWGWACYRLRHRGAPWGKPLLVAALALLAVVAPWFVRNYRAFDQFLPFRSNFWLEVQLGNNPQAPVMLVGDYHPASNANEFAGYQHLGELRYMADKRRQALEFITAHPGTFVWLTVRRVAFVWTGLWIWDPRYLSSEPLRLPFIFFNSSLTALAALGLLQVWRKSNQNAFPLVIMLVCQPLVYYFTHPAIEYRHALDPVLVVLATCGMLKFAVSRKRLIATYQKPEDGVGK